MSTKTMPARPRPKRRRSLAPRHAERIRYGILTAREDREASRLTPAQHAFLAECRRGVLLMLGDTGTRKPYNRETARIWVRFAAGVK